MNRYYWNWQAFKRRWQTGGWRWLAVDIYFELPPRLRQPFWNIVKRYYWR
jgi:hypothetical protein